MILERDGARLNLLERVVGDPFGIALVEAVQDETQIAEKLSRYDETNALVYEQIDEASYLFASLVAILYLNYVVQNALVSIVFQILNLN